MRDADVDSGNGSGADRVSKGGTVGVDILGLATVGRGAACVGNWMTGKASLNNSRGLKVHRWLWMIRSVPVT